MQRNPYVEVSDTTMFNSNSIACKQKGTITIKAIVPVGVLQSFYL